MIKIDLDIGAELARVSKLRNAYIDSYEQQRKDVETGALPSAKFATESVGFEAECFMKIYGMTTYLLELCKLTLEKEKEGRTFLEQNTKDSLEKTIEELSTEIEDREKHMVKRLYRGYEAGF